jgi:hypothetical protein
MKTKTIAEMCGAADIDHAAMSAELAEATQVIEIGGLTFHVRYHAPSEAGQETQQPSIEEN